MTPLRDWHGVTRYYVRADGAHAPTLAALATHPLRLSRAGVLAAWGASADDLATILLDVRQAPCAPAPPPIAAPFALALETAVAAIARTATAPVVALGGGVDGAAVLAAWRATGAPMPLALTLETGLAGYDEVVAAQAIAATLGARCEVVAITPAALVALAPAAAVLAEAPLYDLHPVHRLALAQAAAARGATTLVTGDGADAVFRGAPDLDYVPLVAALTRRAGLALASPFFAPAVLAATPRDPDKRAVRAYVAAAGLAGLAAAPKRPRAVPTLDLAPILDSSRIAALARALELPPAATVGWATLDHLVRALEAA